MTEQPSIYTFRSVRLQKVLVYEDATLRLDYPGLTTIRGRDLDSRLPRQTNMVGKSLLVSCIANVLRHAPPMSQRKVDRAAALKPGSALTLDLAYNQREWSINQTCKGQSAKYKVFRDGKDLELRTTPIAQRFITENLCPWNESQYYTLQYLDGRRPFMFQMGTDTQRLEFFTELFDLHDLDAQRKALLSKRQDFAYQVAGIDTLNAEIATRSEEIEKSGWSAESDTYLERYVYRQRQFEIKHRKLSQQVQQATAYQVATSEAREIKRSVEEKARVAYFIPAKTARADLKALDDYERFQDKHKAWAKDKERSARRLERLKSDVSHGNEKRFQRVEKLVAKIGGAVAALTEKKNELDSTLATMRSEYAKLSVAAKDAPSKVTPAKLEKKKHGYSMIVRMDKLLKSGHSACPTCGQGVSRIDVQRAKDAKKALLLIERQLEALDAKAKLDELTRVGKEKRASFDAVASMHLTEQKAKLSKLLAQKKQLKLALDTERELRLLEKHHAALLKAEPKAVAKPTSTQSRKQLTAILSAHADLRELKRRQEMLVIPDAPKLKLKTLLRQQAKYTVRLNKLSKRVANLQVAKQTFTLATAAIAKAQKKLAGMKQMLSDLKVLDVLINIHSNKGLKVRIVQEVAQQLEHTMNELQGLVFPEPVAFKIDVKPNQFSVLFKKRGRAFDDVRRMSGAESRIFALLMLAALLPTVPARLRSNLVILDEMDANMSESLRVQVASDFLPHLASIVPSVIVVTPDLRTSYPGRELIVQLKGGRSTLIGAGS